ncbi:hypothetical protein PFLUV_G00213780 [Perca fluviatilis]|uniref:Uncharacterized protein n=1 Tax=Perca fluviatilis TaxID=8168 RepID=A0A6A5EEA5_PERFL|nr:hypothetical protein PFLUV_G00213780 [Perca fluviatilis]
MLFSQASCSVLRILNFSCAPSDASIPCIFDRKFFLTSQEPKLSPPHINMLWGKKKITGELAQCCICTSVRYAKDDLLQPYRLYHISSMFMLLTSLYNVF